MRQFELSLDDQNPSSDEEDAAAILEGLNPQQQEAARATDGPVLIIAGPGSGKTRTLTHRIAFLLASSKATPREILAVTFTNKAAREMRERVEKLTGADRVRGMWMGTFHSVCARILRYEADHIGFTSDFSIYDTDDSRRVLKALMDEHHIDSQKLRPQVIQRLISGAKNQMVGPEQYARIATGPAQDAAARLYEPYQKALRRANALDFDDLLLRPIEIFNQEPEVLQTYQERWRYIHVDEYQDTNHAQYILTKMLAARHCNLCVVGDDAQSIYAFRGANIENILSFQRDYEDATVVRLEQNYRSTGHILRLADSIIDHNETQLDKELWTDKGEGEPVVLMEALSEKDEAQKIEQVIRDLHLRHGYGYGDFAILYRTNAQSRSLEEALRRGGIRYRVVGGLSFYQRREIKDVLAYLRLLVNPNDSASLRRVINYPKRGIGRKTQERIFDHARKRGITPWQAIEHLEEIGLSTRAENAVRGFREIIAGFIERADESPADEITKEIIKRSGITTELKGENTRESLMRLENVQELINAIAEFAGRPGENGTLSTFLQEVSLLTDLDETGDEGDRVTLMTIHASKGLEFPVVFITGLEEGLFPLSRAAQDPDELEEERRLFYVAATRAEEHLYLSHARTRYRYGSEESSLRSRFLEEIDPSVVKTRSGGRIRTRPDRFSSRGGGPSSSYEKMDPHYYRESLRNGGSTQNRRTRKTSRPSSGRRIVYDEGEGQIVPGVKVEHETFGEGKVQSLDGQGEQTTAVVFFKDVGQKKLKLKFARLRVIG